ncbi:unnamed protein product [Polarella glacialis]|uniref:SAP domain-containing protein n=1 Tax=Polarella glacialis TaxID=89957 RepID=A0A813FPI1_POLGL|nr:unnamed protein product [Polarella glacialis]
MAKASSRFEAMTMRQLREQCQGFGLGIPGYRKDLTNRLKLYRSQQARPKLEASLCLNKADDAAPSVHELEVTLGAEQPMETKTSAEGMCSQEALHFKEALFLTEAEQAREVEESQQPARQDEEFVTSEEQPFKEVACAQSTLKSEEVLLFPEAQQAKEAERLEQPAIESDDSIPSEVHEVAVEALQPMVTNLCAQGICAEEALNSQEALLLIEPEQAKKVLDVEQPAKQDEDSAQSVEELNATFAAQQQTETKLLEEVACAQETLKSEEVLLIPGAQQAQEAERLEQPANQSDDSIPSEEKVHEVAVQAPQSMETTLGAESLNSQEALLLIEAEQAKEVVEVEQPAKQDEDSAPSVKHEVAVEAAQPMETILFGECFSSRDIETCKGVHLMTEAEQAQEAEKASPVKRRRLIGKQAEPARTSLEALPSSPGPPAAWANELASSTCSPSCRSPSRSPHGSPSHLADSTQRTAAQEGAHHPVQPQHQQHQQLQLHQQLHQMEMRLQMQQQQLQQNQMQVQQLSFVNPMQAQMQMQQLQLQKMQLQQQWAQLEQKRGHMVFQGQLPTAWMSC